MVTNSLRISLSLSRKREACTKGEQVDDERLQLQCDCHSVMLTQLTHNHREPTVSQPRYRIQTVSQMTGIPAATLRAWERRYGFPEPERTQSSYRLYSERDVSSIKQLKTLCEQGISTSEAVRTVRARFAKPQGLLEPSTSPSVSRSNKHDGGKPSTNHDFSSGEWTSPATATTSPDQSLFEDMRVQLLDAVHRFDPVALERSIRRSMLLGSAKRVFDGIFAPVLAQVGDEWHEGAISIAQEHLATEAIGNATRDLLRIVQPDSSAKQILLACVSGELHALPLYGSALHFIQWGYRVVILGVNTPPSALAQSVSHIKPDAVGLSVTCPSSIETTKSQIPEYMSACGGRPLIVGGSGAQLVREEVESEGGLIALGNPNTVRELFEVMVTRSGS